MDLTGYLWIAGAVLLAAVLVLALVLVMLRRYRAPLERLFAQLDQALARHAPGLWRFVRQRFSLGAWHGLALTAAVALIFVATTAFAGVTESWQDREVFYQVDQQVVVLAGALSASTVEVFRWITYAGDFFAVLLIGLPLAAQMLWRKHRWRLLAFLLAAVGGQAVLWMMKWVFGRMRPEGGIVEVASASFPSGHTFTATVFYGFIIFLFWHWTVPRWLRYGATLLLSVLILSVALSRVIIGVHWVSDVIGGLLLGLAWLLLSLVAVRALQAWKAPAEAHRTDDDV